MSDDNKCSFGNNSFSAKNSSERNYNQPSRRRDDNEMRRSRSPKDRYSGSSSRRSGSPPADRRRDRSRERERGANRPPRHYDRNERRARGYDNRRDSRKDDDDAGDKDRPSWENSKVRRHADKIQQRKLLWSKAKDDGNSAESSDGQAPQTSVASGGGVAGGAPKVLESAWTSRLAAATSDSKQIDKFQRLMGIKKSAEEAKPASTDSAGGSSSNAGGVVDKAFLEKERQRQAELTAQLDKQYAMARASTHLGRGKGLGFSG